MNNRNRKEDKKCFKLVAQQSCGVFDPCGSRQMDVQARPHGSLPAEIVPQRFRCDTIRILKDTGFLTCAPLSIPGLHGRINRHTPFSEALNKRTG